MSSYRCSTGGAGDTGEGSQRNLRNTSDAPTPEKAGTSPAVQSRKALEFLQELQMLEKRSKEIRARDQKTFDYLALLEREFDCREKDDAWQAELVKSLTEAKAVLQEEEDGTMADMAEILKDSVHDKNGRLPILSKLKTLYVDTKEIDPETGKPVKVEVFDEAAKSTNSYSVGYPRKTVIEKTSGSKLNNE